MRFGTVAASIAVALTLLACSKPEPPAAASAPAPPTAAQPAAVVPPPNPAANPQAKPAGPQATTVQQMPAGAPTDYRAEKTPCHRNEPGWKWVGNLVENGQCAVGPCDCVKE